MRKLLYIIAPLVLICFAPMSHGAQLVIDTVGTYDTPQKMMQAIDDNFDELYGAFANVAAFESFLTGAGAYASDILAVESEAGLAALLPNYIDQAVTSGSSPTLDGANFSGIPIATGITGSVANLMTALSGDGAYAPTVLGWSDAAAARTSLNVEDGADVTDETNVATAGAIMDGDFTANGFMRRTGAGAYTSCLDKFDGTAAPQAATDDTTLGYCVGSIWLDTTNDKAYVCLDDTDGSAVWTETTQSGSNPTTADISDVSVTQTELAELETVGATTISAAQWAGLGGATTAGIALWDDADAAAQQATLGLVIGTDVLAEQTIGIANDNLVEMDDADAADNDYAKFTANGLEGRSYAEVRQDLGIDNAANLESSLSLGAYASDILACTDSDDLVTALGLVAGDIPDLSGTYEPQLVNSAGLYGALSDETGSGAGALAVFNDNPTLDGLTMGGNLALNAYEIQSTSDVVVQLGDNAGSNVFEVEDSDGTAVWWVDSNGITHGLATNNPSLKLDENDGTDYWLGIYDTTTDRVELRRSATANTNVDAYWDANGAYVAGNMNISTGHTYQISGTQINIGNLGAGGNWTPTGTLNLDSATLQNIGHGTVTDGSNYTTISNNADHDTVDELFNAINSWAEGVSAGTLVSLSDVGGDDVYTSGYILIGDGSDSYDPKAISGDISLGSDGATTIQANAVEESMLKAVDAASDEDFLTYESTTGDFEWHSAADVADNIAAAISAGALTDNSIIDADLDDDGNFTFTGTWTFNTQSVVFGVAPTLPADSIDTITEIAAALKSGADGTLLTGTAGTNTYTAVWDGNGDLVDGYDPATKADVAGDVFTGTHDFGGADDLEIPNGTNPTTDIAGQIAIDSDDNFLEIYGSAVRSIPTEFPITFSVYKPNELDDAQRDFMPFFTNNTGASITITKIYAMADVDDCDFRIEEYDADGSSNEALVKAETCDTGSGPYTNDAQGTITNATVENGHVLVFDSDDTDVPDYVHFTIWYTVGEVD
jgi:hypothetical protein